MKLGKLSGKVKAAKVALGLVMAWGAVGCGREHIKAIEMANEADRAVKVNVEGAIQKYEEASRLDPTNHRILWKLAKAYQKKEDWDNMASALSRASAAAPTFANYMYNRGLALMKKAAAGNPDAYAEAKGPLQKCIETDPNYAECYHELGEALLWTDDAQGALENYSKAIEHDPTVPYFYPPLAELLITLRFYDQAGKVLAEGTRIIQPTEETKNNLYGMYVLYSQVHQASKNMQGMIDVLEKADAVAGADHPEIAFNLGSTYAVMGDAHKEKAVRLLKSFNKRGCRGDKAKQFQDQCTTSQNLVQKLGGE